MRLLGLGLPELLIISIPFIFGAIGRYISVQKKRSLLEGYLFGFFLGPIGLIIIALLPTGNKEP
jgi:hypothetical protein